MRICAVIVAGGRSSRMGREKAFERIRGRSILERIIERIEFQVSAVVINANTIARFRHTERPVIRDTRPEIGTPLAGLHASLVFAAEHGFGAVLTVPSDTPFVPADLVHRLSATRSRAAIASSGSQVHYLTGLWSPVLLDHLEHALDHPRITRLQDWVKVCDAAIVDWPVEAYDPFFNVNTPQELAEAERIAAEFGL